MNTGHWKFCLTATVAAMAWMAAFAGEPIKNSDCLQCHEDKELAKTNSVGRTISLFVDAAKLAGSIHATNTCVSCHADITVKHPDDNAAAKPVNCVACHEKQSRSYGASVHGLAVRAGNQTSATCTDCHGAHEVLPPSSPASPLHRTQLATTCGECHAEAAKDVQESVHGTGLANGAREAPTCTDCHSEHKIEPLKSSSPRKIAEQVCSRCHASERINTKFNLPGDRVKTFFESYHGLAAQYGSTVAANCASCHGVHKILPSSDVRSTIHARHLVETCGKCHAGAGENFALSKVHVDRAADQDIGALLNRWVRRIYLGLIAVVISALAGHNLLLWLRKALAALRSPIRSVARLSKSQRVQHLILLVSFIVLALTGFALRFPDSWLAWMLGACEPLRRWSHRVAGIVLLMLGIYHVAYLLKSRDGRQLLREMLPAWKDLADLKTNTAYLLGRSHARPRFGRFGYIEKFEYWAVIWGTVIMGVTGLMIWMKMDVTRFLPRWVVDVATTIHYYEAILACLAIVVWHFYHVIFDPDVYPINWAWWDGKVPAEKPDEDRALDGTRETRTPSPKTADQPCI
ncbi:MAG: cytochrome b/b6 domain-containing protein [Verrucomicrobia bacterium]|nr:cytochrome b/b6 domain-containing protein [Verrucomicrobiota bacterium]